MVGDFRHHLWRKTALPVAGAVWLALSLAGLKWMLDYQSAPGRSAAPPSTWPVASKLPRTPGRPTLVLLAHPRCPCTRATLSELEHVIAAVPGRVDVDLVLVVPPGRDAAWARGDLWFSGARIPGVTVVLDDRAREAARFGAWTSGQVILFDAAGRLEFSGGITPGRGHAGDNAGRDAVIALVRGSGAGSRTFAAAAAPHGSWATATPVFGCPLFPPHPGDSTCSR